MSSELVGSAGGVTGVTLSGVVCCNGFDDDWGVPGGRSHRVGKEIMDTRNGLTFDQWFKRCDVICGGIAGVGIDDLADGPSWDRWEDGCSPREYVIERLEEEGFPSELLS